MASYTRHATLCTALLLVLPMLAQAREPIRVVGSATVFPFVAAAAEQFGREGTYRTPIVESTGTGGGLKSFCDGIGANYPDIANASRAIKPAEQAACVAHGITDIAELTLGYDGIVLASSRATSALPLTRRALFLALAREVPVQGKLVPNPYQRWREVDPALPDAPIRVYGRPPSSGTRDAFSELVMIEGCKHVPEMAALLPDAEARKHACMAMREDGNYIEAGDDNNLIVQKLINNPEALGIFGYSFLEANAALVQPSPVDGVMPSEAAITDGSYPVARPLYVYLKKAHLKEVRGLADFARSLMSDAASGPDGYLATKGLIPLRRADHEAMQARAAAL